MVVLVALLLLVLLTAVAWFVIFAAAVGMVALGAVLCAALATWLVWSYAYVWWKERDGAAL